MALPFTYPYSLPHLKLSEFTLTRPQRSPSPPPASPRRRHYHLDFLLHRFLDFTFVTFLNSPILIWTSVSAHLYISYASFSCGVDQHQKLHRSSPILLLLLYSSFRLISSSSLRDRHSPFLIVFVTRVGLAQRNSRPRPCSVSRSCHPYLLSPRPAHTYTQPV